VTVHRDSENTECTRVQHSTEDIALAGDRCEITPLSGSNCVTLDELLILSGFQLAFL
jgi:hypothetical protein